MVFAVGVIILLVGVFALFRGSLPWIGIRSRKVGAVVLAVGLVITLLGMPRAEEPVEEEVPLEPGIALEKTGPEEAEPGDDIYFEFIITNTGEAELTDIVLQDPLLGVDGQDWEFNEIADLEAGESYILESPAYNIASEQAGEEVVNTANVTAMTADEEEVTASAEHVVAVEEVLEPVAVTYEGDGDEAFAMDPPEPGPMILTIRGNQEAEAEFVVESFDDEGELIATLVDTEAPYEGVLYDEGEAAYLEITAADQWSVEVRALRAAESLEVPGTMEGSGDYVFLLENGATTAEIVGNEEGEYFAVRTHNDVEDILVETEDPYQGRVRVAEDARVVEIHAVGDWSIEME